jgi:YbbR domain-containing protein
VSFFRIIVNLFQFNRTNWKAVVLCLAAATVFWLFSALNKNHTANLRFPLYFNFDRERYVPMDIPQTVVLNVSGNGWELLRNSLGIKVSPLEITLERPTEVKKIVASTLPPVFSGQLTSLEIHHVLTDTLFVQVEPHDVHKFTVRADLSKISFRKGYGRISPIVLLPDTVELMGPKSIVHSLPDSITVVASQKRISENYQEEIEVMVPSKVERHPPVIEVTFEVGEVIEIEKNIKLEFTNTPEKVKISLASDSILCKLQAPKRDEGKFNALFKDAKAVVDLSNLSKGESKLIPTLMGLPSYVQMTSSDTLRLTLY